MINPTKDPPILINPIQKNNSYNEQNRPVPNIFVEIHIFTIVIGFDEFEYDKVNSQIGYLPLLDYLTFYNSDISQTRLRISCFLFRFFSQICQFAYFTRYRNFFVH